MSKYEYKFSLDTAEKNTSHTGLAMRIERERKVLELGCSYGYLSKFLSEELACDVVGVDCDKDALLEAAKVCSQVVAADLDKDDWLSAIKDKQFDIILCADVLEHVKHPQLLLSNLKAFLHPDGKVLASIPNVAHSSVRLELLQGHFDYEKLGIMDDTHLHFYTRSSAIRLFMDAGYFCSDIAYSTRDLADETIAECLANVGLKVSPEIKKFLRADDALAYQFIIEARSANPQMLVNKPPVLSPKPLVSSGVFYQQLKDIVASLQVHNENHEKHIAALQETVSELQNKLSDERLHNENHLKNIKDLEIVNLKAQYDEQNFKNHIQRLEKECRDTQAHNDNHQKHVRIQQESIEALKEQLQNKIIDEKNHLANIGELGEKIDALEQRLKDQQLHGQNYKKAIKEWENTTRILDAKLFELTEQRRLEQEKLQTAEHQQHHLHDQLNKQQNHIRNLEDRVVQLNQELLHLQQVLQRVHGKLSYKMVRLAKGFPKQIKNLAQLKKPVPHAQLEASQSISGEALAEFTPPENMHDYDAWLAEYGDVDAVMQAKMRAEIQQWNSQPLIAVLMPVYNPSAQCLENALNSVCHQVYENFQLCIADDASTMPHVAEILQRFSAKDARIQLVMRENNGHISAASNSALELVHAEYVALMDHDDLLAPDALFWVAKAIQQNPKAQLIYSDEDKMDQNGRRYAPYFKPDWNPELFLSHNFICHLGVYKTEKVRELGGFDSSLDGAQDYDLALRYIDTIKEQEIIHIPRILYHWRAVDGSTANGVHEKPYAEEKIKRSVENALHRKHRKAKVYYHKLLPGALRVSYQLPKNLPLVSIIIPTRNGFHLLRQCVESILAKTAYQNYEIIIIDNGSDDLVVLRYLQRLQENPQVRVLRDDSPFNYAALNNKAVAEAKGEIIALLNNDLEVISRDWLGEMVSHVLHEEVGAVGAKLYYPDDTVQHAGVIIGLGGVAGHSHKHFPRDNPGYCGRLVLTQNLSAVTAACLLVRKAVFEEIAGFDEQHLHVAFNDVDLCLRIREKGYQIVWSPYAEMYHHESATRGYEDTPEKQKRFTEEIDYMKHRWEQELKEDPAYNPNLVMEREDFAFAWPPRKHQLNYIK